LVCARPEFAAVGRRLSAIWVLGAAKGAKISF
jgi:hypothetical protein